MATGTGDYKQLYYAARDGELTLVRFYLGDHDLNFMHPEFLTAPLHESIRNGHLAVSRFLLENGASPTLREGYSDVTPLMIAQAADDRAAIDLLAQFGVEVETPVWVRVKAGLFSYFAALVKF